MSNSETYNNQSAYVSECKITLPSGQTEDLKNLLIEISYFEDIYSFSVSGYLMIRDGIGLIDLLQLQGSEAITLHFDKYSNTESSTLPPKVLVAYTISDRRHVNQSSQIYKLHFCSLDLLKNQQSIVSKSYKGKGIDFIVDDILNNELKTITPISVIQPTMASYDYVPPSIRPFEVISEISNLARPANKLNSADMFLFENRFGYNFLSIKSAMDQTPFFTYRFEQANIKNKKDDTYEDDSILDLEYVRSYNTLRAISNGSIKNQVIGYNPALGKVIQKNFNVDDQQKDNSLNYFQDSYAATTQKAVTPSHIRVVTTNSGMISDDYIKNKTDITPDFFIQETYALRTAELSLESYVVLKIIVPGHAYLTAGSTVNIEIFATQLGEGNNRKLDSRYSGKYLITAARHIIQSSGVYQTILEITKFNT